MNSGINSNLENSNINVINTNSNINSVTSNINNNFLQSDMKSNSAINNINDINIISHPISHNQDISQAVIEDQGIQGENFKSLVLGVLTDNNDNLNIQQHVDERREEMHFRPSGSTFACSRCSTT